MPQTWHLTEGLVNRSAEGMVVILSNGMVHVGVMVARGRLEGGAALLLLA